MLRSVDNYQVEILITLALALSLPPGPMRDAVATITYAVVVFSILVQGLRQLPVTSDGIIVYYQRRIRFVPSKVDWVHETGPTS